MTRGVAHEKADEVDLHAVRSVRSGDLGVHFGPHHLDDGTDAGSFLIFGIGEPGAAPTYLEVCLYPPDRSGTIGGRGTEGAGEHPLPALFGAMVDENWRLRLVPSRGAAPFFAEDDVGGSVLPTVHPADLPKLLTLGTSVRSGALDLMTISLNLRRVRRHLGPGRCGTDPGTRGRSRVVARAPLLGAEPTAARRSGREVVGETLRRGT